MAKPPFLPPARGIALACLQAVLLPGRGPGPGVQEALDRELSRRSPAPRDAALATELAYGVLRHKGRLDHVLDHFLRAPGKVPPRLRLALETAAYELLFLDRVPAYATLDWCVGHVRASKWGGKGLAGMANAVLRRVSEQAVAAREPGYYRQDRPSEAEFLSRYYSCPRWIVDLWLGAYGPDTARQYLAASVAAPPPALRVNTGHERGEALMERLAVREDILDCMHTGFAFAGPGPEDFHELLAQGLASRQSLAAQEAMLALAPETWQEPVWDACAGRGGKTAMLLEGGMAPVWASDPHAGRLRGLRRELQRLGLPEIPVFRADACRPPLCAHPRTVLLDAPCTGMGVLSRRPDAKWRRTPADASTLARTQDALLAAAHAVLPPGGRIAYLTCTLNPAENRERVDSLLASAQDTVLEHEWATPPDSPLAEFFYCALLRKQG
jgi:16S rRNA (cytosine967-C5)-methyltransferase